MTTTRAIDHPRQSAAILESPQRLFVDGRFVDSQGETLIDVINPATGEILTRAHEATPADVDAAVVAARRAFEGPWRRMSAADRSRLLHRLADLIERDAEPLAALESLNAGKIISDSRGDIQGVVEVFRYYAGFTDKIEGRTIPLGDDYLCYTLRQPLGVVGQIVPWNFPLLLLAWKWGPALACGNTIVMKLAEQTPLSGMRLCELALEAGFPDGVINVLNGRGETTGAAIVTHPGIDKIAFTGHVDTAKAIQKAAADTLKRCTFELGGKSPNVVFADADLDAAVEGAFHAVYFNGGQCCTAGSRLFVERSIQAEFVARLAEAAKRRTLGDPLDERTQQGPQVSREQMEKVLRYVAKGEQEGATLVSGGHRSGSCGYFVEPTIFDNVADHMAIARDEIFGPVLAVLPFDGFDGLVRRANDTTYGLAAGIWTKNIDKAMTFAREVRAGTVWVNCYHVVTAQTPFGGFKMSGHGRENGEAAIEHYTERKTVTIRLAQV